jgi:hypothetical protein
VITVNRYSPFGQTSLADPNLPLRAEVSNNTTASPLSLFVGGRQYNIIGNYDPVFRVTSERRQITCAATLTPIISFRRKAVFPAGSGRTNSVSIKLEGIDLVTSSDIYWQIVLDGTIDGAFANYPTATTNIPLTETALLVNSTLTTITGGQVLLQGLAAGVSGSSRILASATLLDFQLPDTGTITLAAANLSGGSNTVAATFQVTEEW